MVNGEVVELSIVDTCSEDAHVVGPGGRDDVPAG